MEKTAINTSSAPQAIGPYSQAITAGGFLFVSGQIAMDPASGHVVAGGVEEQARRVMQNLQAILIHAGSNFEKVVKTTIFLKEMGDFAKVNEIYGSFFSKAFPARETVEVSRLPKDVLVEISCIAII